MQTKLDRRQLLGRSVGLVFAALVVGACDGNEDAEPVSAELAATIRAEYARGDVIVCNGYVLSRTEAQLWQTRDLC